jgi:hypothetical protein
MRHQLIPALENQALWRFQAVPEWHKTITQKLPLFARSQNSYMYI